MKCFHCGAEWNVKNDRQFTICPFCAKPLNMVAGNEEKVQTSVGGGVSSCPEQYFTIRDGILIKYSGDWARVVIPNHVSVIEHEAFRDSTVFTVEIPGQVYAIGKDAFRNCGNLRKVIMHEGVGIVMDRAFMDCKKLESITVPQSLKSCGEDVVRGCVRLQNSRLSRSWNDLKRSSSASDAVTTPPISSVAKPEPCLRGNPRDFDIVGSIARAYLGKEPDVYIPEGITETGVVRPGIGMCQGRNDIRKVVFPGSMRKIGSRAFAQCLKLEEVVIPEGVTIIESEAFMDCKNLRKIIIPNSVRTMGTSVFQGCTSLRSVVLPASMERISACTFRDCSGLDAVTMPKRLKSIENGAFGGCYSLKHIDLPEALCSLGNGAFQNCSALAHIQIPSFVDIIGESAFSGCTALRKVEFGIGVVGIGRYAFAGCTGLTELCLPQGMRTIHDRAFVNCFYLQKISIPDSVTVPICTSPFEGCTALQYVSCPDHLCANAFVGSLYYEKARTQALSQRRCLYCGRVLPLFGKVCKCGQKKP